MNSWCWNGRFYPFSKIQVWMRFEVEMNLICLFLWNIFFLPSSRGSKRLGRGVETSFSTFSCFLSVSFLINGARAPKKRGAFLPGRGRKKWGWVRVMYSPRFAFFPPPFFLSWETCTADKTPQRAESPSQSNFPRRKEQQHEDIVQPCPRSDARVSRRKGI